MLAFNFGASELIGLIIESAKFFITGTGRCSENIQVNIRNTFQKNILQLSLLSSASISSATSQATSFGDSALYMLLPTITQSAPAAITSEAFPP